MSCYIEYTRKTTAPFQIVNIERFSSPEGRNAVDSDFSRICRRHKSGDEVTLNGFCNVLTFTAFSQVLNGAYIVSIQQHSAHTRSPNMRLSIGVAATLKLPVFCAFRTAESAACGKFNVHCDRHTRSLICVQCHTLTV